MKSRTMCLLVCAVGLLLAGCGRVSPGRIERAAARAAERRAAGVMARDLARDSTSRATRLGAERRVYKYATEPKALLFEQKGFPPGTHFTASAGPGRPPSAKTAQQHFGLSYRPNRRLGVTLPEGTQVKSNKVVGGSPGYGEIRSEKRLPPGVIGSDLALKPGRD